MALPNRSSLLAVLAPRRGWVLAAIVVLAAVLRLQAVTVDGLTSDEAFSWRLAAYPWGELLRRAAADVHPPLYYLLLKPWLALWGDAPLALRGLSVLLGVLVVPLTYGLVRELGRARRLEESASPSGGCALLAALLVAVHPAQVFASQNARMYSLSAALAVLSTILLLRALRLGRGWWVYGVAAAAACATHYYAFFGVAAQALGALWLLRADVSAAGRLQARRAARGFVTAGLVGTALYLAWLPAFYGQVTRVGANYWIPRVTWAKASVALATWVTGLEREALAGAGVGIAVVALLATAVVAWRADRGGLFLLVQCAVPWALALAISVATSRSIFLPRYLVPMQVFFLAFWAVSARRLRASGWRVTLASVLVVGAVVALVRAKAQMPDQPLAEEQAAAFVAERHREGDVILTDSPRASNRLRYYLAQRGVSAPVMHCLLAPTAEDVGHFAHTAVLESGELLAAEALDTADWRRLWWGLPASTPQPLPSTRWQRVIVRHISGGGDTHYMLARYVRVERVGSLATLAP